MKQKLLIAALMLLAISSCKKSDNPANTGVTVDNSGNLSFGSTADGACYGIVTRTYLNTTGTSNDEMQSAVAWFGKFPSNITYAGTLSVNDNELDTMFNMYQYIGIDNIFTTGYVFNWNCAGNTSTGMPAFTHSESGLPTAAYFTLPATININNNFTINHTAVSNVLGIIYQLAGNYGQKTKFVSGGGSSVTFTPAELQSVAVSGGDAIAFSFTVVEAKPVVLSGKNIYFVKEICTQRETVTL